MSMFKINNLWMVGEGEDDKPPPVEEPPLCRNWMSRMVSLRRTLACARGETTTLCILVFVENLVGLFVLSNFVQTGNWIIAIAYSLGGSLGSFCVMKIGKKSDKSS